MDHAAHRHRLAARKQRRRWPAALLVATVGAIALMLGPPTVPAAATAADEAEFLTALNEVRAENGLPLFSSNPELAALARDHAAVMADTGEIFHASPISEGYRGEWQKLGENVGVGAGVAVLIDAFLASPGHFANIVDPAFTEVGIGVVRDGTSLYTTHRFLQPPGAGSPTTPPSVDPTTTAPPSTTTTASSTTSPPNAPTTTVPPAVPTAPPITAERVLALLEMLELIGT